MNERLIQSFIDSAAQALGPGNKAHTLVSLVAAHCALICDSLNDGEETEASEIIRAAFVPSLSLKPTARAAHEATH